MASVLNANFGMEYRRIQSNLIRPQGASLFNVNTKMVTIIFLLTCVGGAQVKTARIFENKPISQSPSYKMPSLCVYFYGVANPHQIVETELKSVSGDTSPTSQHMTISEQRSNKISSMVERSLQDLEKTHGYAKEKTNYLRQLDISLDPKRTVYIQLTNEDNPAMLRIFDGSTQIKKGSIEWQEGGFGDARMPLERENPNLQLPERQREKNDPNKKAYLLEIGLLNVDRNLSQGVELLLTHVAKTIDMHYNEYGFMQSKSTETLEKLDVIIYAQTKSKKVKVFEKYGFQPVLQVSTSGEIKPHLLNDDYVLMYFKASDLVKRYFSGRQYVNRKKETDDYKPEDDANYDKHFREMLMRLNQKKIPLETFKDLQREAFSIFKKYVAARIQSGETLIRKDLLIDFFEEYYVFINSIPEKMRHKNWQNIKMLLAECLKRGNPFDALYIFSLSVDKALGVGHLSNTYSESDFNYFINRPYLNFKLLFPSEPTIVFSYSQ